jgi:hypothetical protein
MDKKVRTFNKYKMCDFSIFKHHNTVEVFWDPIHPIYDPDKSVKKHSDRIPPTTSAGEWFFISID